MLCISNQMPKSIIRIKILIVQVIYKHTSYFLHFGWYLLLFIVVLSTILPPPPPIAFVMLTLIFCVLPPNCGNYQLYSTVDGATFLSIMKQHYFITSLLPSILIAFSRWRGYEKGLSCKGPLTGENGSIKTVPVLILKYTFKAYIKKTHGHTLISM